MWAARGRSVAPTTVWAVPVVLLRLGYGPQTTVDGVPHLRDLVHP